MKTCVFAGSFDPFTTGHLYVVNKCLEIFDKVVVLVGVNVDKKPLFPDRVRVDAIKSIFNNNEKVVVDTFSGMLTDYMKKNNIFYTVRGLRNQDDYKYENTMAQYNLDLFPEISTIYIPTPLSLCHISSTAIRNIINSKGDFSNYVPESSLEILTNYLKDN
jgi:pantetheine-phosphate adenylyltransferase